MDRFGDPLGADVQFGADVKINVRPLPTRIPWLLYRTPLLVAYHRRGPNIDTSWLVFLFFFCVKREQAVPRGVSRQENLFLMDAQENHGAALAGQRRTERVPSEVCNFWSLRNVLTRTDF